MNNTLPIRKPQQKRSIEKKDKIIKAGFELFCEKGYHKVTTTDIADKAGVSTGTVYSYFKDKKDIYIAAFEYFLNTHLQPLVDDLAKTPKPIVIKQFVDKCIDMFINLYVTSKKQINELGMMQDSDPDILQYFAAYEDIILSSLVKTLDSPNVNQQNINEKVYVLYSVAELFAQEYAYSFHKNINIEVLREETSTMLTNMFLIKE